MNFDFYEFGSDFWLLHDRRWQFLAMIEFKEAKILEKAKEKEEAKRAKKLEEEKIYEERIQKLERFRGLALTDEKPRRRNSFSSTLESTECFWDG